MRFAATLVVMLLVGGSGNGGTQDAGVDAGEVDSGAVDAGGAPPADAGIPSFTAATFCEVFARTSCRWGVNCGQPTPAEEARCVTQLMSQCPKRTAFNATAAQVCLV